MGLRSRAGMSSRTWPENLTLPTCLADAPAARTPVAAGCQLSPRLAELPFQPLALLDQAADPLGQVCGRGLEDPRRLAQQAVLAPEVLERRLPGHRLDPAHAGGKGAFA